MSGDEIGWSNGRLLARDVSHQPGGREFKRDPLRGSALSLFYARSSNSDDKAFHYITHDIRKVYVCARVYSPGMVGNPQQSKKEVGVQMRRLAMGSVSWRYPWRKKTISELAVGG